MNVSEISLREYDELGGIHHQSGPILTTEKAWFRCSEVLGVVLLDLVDNDWSWVVLAKHPDRGMNYRAIDLKTSCTSFAEAHSQLSRAMKREATAWNRFRDIHTPDPES
jgi:hypothetical protein